MSGFLRRGRPPSASCCMVPPLPDEERQRQCPARIPTAPQPGTERAAPARVSGSGPQPGTHPHSHSSRHTARDSGAPTLSPQMGFGTRSTPQTYSLQWGVPGYGGSRETLPASPRRLPRSGGCCLGPPSPRGQRPQLKQGTEPLHHSCIKNLGEGRGSCGAPEAKPQSGDTPAQDHGCHPGTLQPRSPAAPSRQRFIFHHLWQKQACCELPGAPAPINIHQAGFMETDGVGGCAAVEEKAEQGRAGAP